jgi:glucosyl-dolichyl phosphate glucuronosyltransferase
MATPVRISVIICAYTEHRWDDLVAAVASVQAQTLPAQEIIVVVDHNPALLAQTRGLVGVTAVENHHPRGLSGARNSGSAVARGAVIAFLDDDAVAAPDWLARLAAGYANPAVMGVGGAIEPCWEAGRPPWFPEEFDWVVGCTYRGMPTEAQPVRNLIGANMSFRREVFTLAGGFQTGIGRVGSLPLGCEETELCIRLRQRAPGAVLQYDPLARVAHRVPAGRATWGYFRARCHAEGISKALVSDLVGQQSALSSETAYVARVLPAGVARGLARAIFKGERAGALRAAAIVTGLGSTTLGYLRGSAPRYVAGLFASTHLFFRRGL